MDSFHGNVLQHDPMLDHDDFPLVLHSPSMSGSTTVISLIDDSKFHLRPRPAERRAALDDQATRFEHSAETDGLLITSDATRSDAQQDYDATGGQATSGGIGGFSLEFLAETDDSPIASDARSFPFFAQQDLVAITKTPPKLNLARRPALTRPVALRPARRGSSGFEGSEAAPTAPLFPTLATFKTEFMATDSLFLTDSNGT